MIPAEDLRCLKAIALRGGCKGPVFVSSQTIGEMLAISPQTASRRLKGLEMQGFITRTIAADGQHVTLTGAGEEELRKEYQEYSRIFAEHNKGYVLGGTVVSGIGEGKYYMSLGPYKQQFLSTSGLNRTRGRSISVCPRQVCQSARRSMRSTGSGSRVFPRMAGPLAMPGVSRAVSVLFPAALWSPAGPTTLTTLSK